MTHNALSKARLALPALLALIALAVVGGQLIHQTSAKAIALTTCTGTGSGQTVPEITSSPTNVLIQNPGGPQSFACDGLVALGGITAAKMTISGHALEALCGAVAADVYVGAQAIGTVTVKWTGGEGGSTLFNWVIAGATQVGPGVSVIAVTGNSARGSYHSGTPATFNALISVTVPSGSCAAGQDTFATATTFIMEDVL